MIFTAEGDVVLYIFPSQISFFVDNKISCNIQDIKRHNILESSANMNFTFPTLQTGDNEIDIAWDKCKVCLDKKLLPNSPPPVLFSNERRRPESVCESVCMCKWRRKNNSLCLERFDEWIFIFMEILLCFSVSGTQIYDVSSISDNRLCTFKDEQQEMRRRRDYRQKLVLFLFSSHFFGK
jgi:hypothetical protein